MGSTAGLEAPAIAASRQSADHRRRGARQARDACCAPHLRAADHMNPASAALAEGGRGGHHRHAGHARQRRHPRSERAGADVDRRRPAANRRARRRSPRTAGASRRRWPCMSASPDSPAGGDAYPNSLMGIIAFNRQAFLDAQWYQQAKTRAVLAGARRHAARARRPDAGGVPRLDLARRACARSTWPRRSSSIRSSPAARQVDDVTARDQGGERARDLQPELPHAAPVAGAGCGRIAQRAARSRQRAEGSRGARQGRHPVRV